MQTRLNLIRRFGALLSAISLVVFSLSGQTPAESPRQSAPRSCYIALKTNMLYDALAVPNLGVEFYAGRNFSVAAQWMHSWWSNESRHRYWRIYGGDITARYWFGSKVLNKPLTGHHAGLYAGALTFDVEWGGTAYMGGRPGHNIFDRCIVNAGLEYGYSLPVARRLNIDFTIGIGYMGGHNRKILSGRRILYLAINHPQNMDWSLKS